MDVTSIQRSQTAPRESPVKIDASARTPVSIDKRDSAGLRSWPNSAQWAAACLFGAAVVFLVVDRCINRYLVEPTTPIRFARIDANQATRSQLLQIPGVGPVLSQHIIDHRKRFGAFASIGDIRKVPGVGDKKAVLLAKHLYVRGEPALPAPLVENAPAKREEPDRAGLNRIDINAATAEQLCTLPGIGPKLSERIITERKRKRFSSINDLQRVYGIGKKTVDRLRELITVK